MKPILMVCAHAPLAAVQEAGGVPEIRGVVPDEAQALEQAIGAAHRECDMTIVSGGTSAGAGDLLYRVVDRVGKPGIVVHGVAVKPGKPTVLAVAFAKPILGLPGYPTSALMIFNLFGAPLIRMMAGDLRPIGRDTQGVTLMNLADDDRIVSIAVLSEI